MFKCCSRLPIVSFSTVQLYPWSNSIRGPTPSMVQLRPWFNSVHGSTPSMVQLRPWFNSVRGPTPSVVQLRPWSNSVCCGSTLSVVQLRPWSNSVCCGPTLSVVQLCMWSNSVSYTEDGRKHLFICCLLFLIPVSFQVDLESILHRCILNTSLVSESLSVPYQKYCF
jgi:hypothetical protein